MNAATKNATAKWTRSLQDELAVKNHGCYFDVEAGLKVVNFFKKWLRHTKKPWAGRPFELLEWQKNDLVMPLFGWKRENGTRRFRKAYVEVAKKNGKSTFCAGVTLYLLTFDNEPLGEIYGVAASIEQASIIFRAAENMAEKTPELKNRLKIIPSNKRIIYPKYGSFYKVLSRAADVSEGPDISGLLFDELHVQRSRNLWESLIYGGAARTQPVFISITTAGYDRETVCWEEHEYAQAVLDGTTEDFSYFPLIYAASMDDDWSDPAVWKKANPSLGVMINEDEFAEECKRALNEPRKLNTFLRRRLNIWTAQDTAWLNPEDWAACAAEYSREDLIDER